jgi:carboxyvinyl-carboxyphosphonate phosphorylmutase
MNLTPRRQALRTIFSGQQCIYPASVSDPLSARAAESLGFETMMFAGSIASLSVLGAPDIIVLTLSEFAAQANRICRASERPLIVDADHGYGNAMNVKRTVEELETAGVSCLTIEDTLLPVPFGSEKTEFLSIPEGRGKMKAALAGRQDKDLILLGRTSAIGQLGVDEAIRRAAEYLEAGVDGIMFVGVKTRSELEAIAKAIDAPIMIGGASPELQDVKYLSECGVRISLQGHQPYMAAVQAMYQSLKALREGVAPADLEGIASSELMKKLSLQDDYDGWQKDFLT